MRSSARSTVSRSCYAAVAEPALGMIRQSGARPRRRRNRLTPRLSCHHRRSRAPPGLNSVRIVCERRWEPCLARSRRRWLPERRASAMRRRSPACRSLSAAARCVASATAGRPSRPRVTSPRRWIASRRGRATSGSSETGRGSVEQRVAHGHSFDHHRPAGRKRVLLTKSSGRCPAAARAPYAARATINAGGRSGAGAGESGHLADLQEGGPRGVLSLAERGKRSAVQSYILARSTRRQPARSPTPTRGRWDGWLGGGRDGARCAQAACLASAPVHRPGRLSARRREAHRSVQRGVPAGRR